MQNSIMKKYFKTRKEALQVCAQRNERSNCNYFKVFKMPKGTRHHDEFAVCSYMEYLNTY